MINVLSIIAALCLFISMLGCLIIGIIYEITFDPLTTYIIPMTLCILLFVTGLILAHRIDNLRDQQFIESQIETIEGQIYTVAYHTDRMNVTWDIVITEYSPEDRLKKINTYGILNNEVFIIAETGKDWSQAIALSKLNITFEDFIESKDLKFVIRQ